MYILWYHHTSSYWFWPMLKKTRQSPPTPWWCQCSPLATTSCSEIIKSKQYIQLIYTLEILNWYLKQLGSVCGGVGSFNMFYMFHQQSWRLTFQRSWASNKEGNLNWHIHRTSRIDIFWIFLNSEWILHDFKPYVGHIFRSFWLLLIMCHVFGCLLGGDECKMARTIADPFKGVLLGMEFAVPTGTPVPTIAMGHAC